MEGWTNDIVLRFFSVMWSPEVWEGEREGGLRSNYVRTPEEVILVGGKTFERLGSGKEEDGVWGIIFGKTQNSGENHEGISDIMGGSGSNNRSNLNLPSR